MLGAIHDRRWRFWRNVKVGEDPSSHPDWVPPDTEGSVEPVLRISPAVLAQIEFLIGCWPAERGGALVADPDGVVRLFYLDSTAATSQVIYTPDEALINELRKGAWRRQGRKMVGFVHSHPHGLPWPSLGDRRYAQRIIEAVDELDALWMPIVQSSADGGSFSLQPVLAQPGANGSALLRPGRLEIEAVDTTGTFARVEGAYDLERLSRSRVVAIGCGGAASCIEQLARCGVGEFVLIDPDVIAESNLATQQTYRRDIGRPKVEALAERLVDINPNVSVIAFQGTLDDLSDAARDRLFEARETDGGRLLCGFTDHFPSQAQVNRLGLQYGVPTLSAQVWQHGAGAEVTFTFPGVTPACQRCALASRYRALIDEGQQPEVGSEGTPIFATERLNALKGFVALALLHHEPSTEPDTAGARWHELLERIGQRNLAMIRMAPDLQSRLGIGAIDRALAGADQQRLLFDETVWLPQQPDDEDSPYGACADCGGVGDLRQLIGRRPDPGLDADDCRGSEHGRAGPDETGLVQLPRVGSSAPTSRVPAPAPRSSDPCATRGPCLPEGSTDGEEEQA